MSHREENRPSEREAIEARAAAWLAEADGGLSPERAAEFARWRADDVRHETAVMRLETAWGALQQLRDFRPEAARHPDIDLLGGRARTGTGRRIAWKGLALAASVALVLAVGWPAGWLPARSEHRYATTVDGYERLTLADGSMVELNSASEIGVQFLPAERRVRLRRGEAHFTVTKDAARPFVVEAGEVAVRAVGTAFNVRLAAQEVEVLVTEGSVEVAKTEELAEPAAARTEKAIPLTANQRAWVTRDGERARESTVEQLAPEAMRAALAWQGPRLVFVNTPLVEAITQFNRRNRVQLELADPELATLPIGGSFRAENVEAFVRLLESGGDAAVERVDAGRLVLRKPK